jgi:hypothetical protein
MYLRKKLKKGDARTNTGDLEERKGERRPEVTDAGWLRAITTMRLH